MSNTGVASTGVGNRASLKCTLPLGEIFHLAGRMVFWKEKLGKRKHSLEKMSRISWKASHPYAEKYYIMLEEYF